MTTEAEQNIVHKLEYFHRNNKIPHIIFYGPTHSAKDMIVSNFINLIYSENMFTIKHNVLFVSCSGKGIKFIRDEIKTFAKMHIHSKQGDKQSSATASSATATSATASSATASSAKLQSATEEQGDTFKTIVLMNADFLTDDAQSALRRSIELFSYNTRFFLLVENKSRLLKPILSRFCEIYVPPHNESPVRSKGPNAIMFQQIDALGVLPTQRQIIDLVTVWYESGYSSYDFIEGMSDRGIEKKLHVQFLFHKLKTEYRCEKLFMWTLLDFYLFRDYADLKRMLL
jgi:hypothetical protein